MNKKEKLIASGILILYIVLLLAGYIARVLDWETIKANYLIAPGLSAITMGLGKKWFGCSLLVCAVTGLVIYYMLLLCGIAAPGTIINMALLAVGVFAGILLDIKKKEA